MQMYNMMYRMFKKELYNGVPNITVWKLLRKRLYLGTYKLSIVQHSNIWNSIVKRFLKHPALPTEATMNRSYSR
jgi:hypothetical protein